MRLIAKRNSTINVIGYDLEAVLVDPNFEDSYSLYQLAARLADGTPITGELIFVLNEHDASLHLLPAVPRPAGLLLVSLAAIAVLATRRH